MICKMSLPHELWYSSLEKIQAMPRYQTDGHFLFGLNPDNKDKYYDHEQDWIKGQAYFNLQVGNTFVPGTLIPPAAWMGAKLTTVENKNLIFEIEDSYVAEYAKDLLKIVAPLLPTLFEKDLNPFWLVRKYILPILNGIPNDRRHEIKEWCDQQHS